MLAGAISLAWTDFTTRPKTLTVGGLTLIGGPASPAYGVAIETIRLIEQGPGQTSSLSFTITDPTGVVTLTAGADVRFRDFTNADLPLFTGFVSSWSSTHEGVGRSIDVECIGIEAMLDWLYVPVVVSWPATPSAAVFMAALQSAIGQALGIGVPLNAAGDSAFGGGSGNSSLATPIGTNGWALPSAGSAGPGSLRSVLTQIMDAARATGATIGTTQGLQLTVDFYGGIRIWELDQNSQGALDYGPFVVSTASAPRPDTAQHRVIPGEAVRQVYVTGGSAAGSGVVSDGTGIAGPTAQISVPSSLTADDVVTYGRSYLLRNGGTTQGTVIAAEAASVNVGNIVTSQRRAGSQLTLTDAQAGVTGFQTQMSSIEKVFYPGTGERWTITYGLRRSGAQYIRQLTRAVLN
jgi:hypothetical protein